MLIKMNLLTSPLCYVTESPQHPFVLINAIKKAQNF